MDALTAMGVDPLAGYLVVAEHLRGVLYVMVPPHTGSSAFRRIPGVRFLGKGQQVLVPRSPCDSSTLAGWVGTSWSLFHLVFAAPDQLASGLRTLAPSLEQAMAS
ncbi:hypothetical protein [Streptomyces sp. bgisy091]|uniref:hypothetical protein n=1 Tax=Streptomyces sp. bgisy091 TaxID=3413778 RepID=UPI003D709CA0